MPKFSILGSIKRLGQPIFTTGELSAFSGRSVSTTVQALNFLQKQGVVLKVHRGIWAEVTNKPLSPYGIIPYLLSGQRAYVSFLSALHLYGVIEQIPQVITLASLSHSKIIRTQAATFIIHRIAPSFFTGFGWYKGTGSFLIAEPEKALIDCLYLSTRKKKQFSYFPELHFPKTFSFAKAKRWARAIPNARIRLAVEKKLEKFLQVKDT